MIPWCGSRLGESDGRSSGIILFAGQEDPILVSIPKGGYVPLVRKAAKGAHPRAGHFSSLQLRPKWRPDRQKLHSRWNGSYWGLAILSARWLSVVLLGTWGKNPNALRSSLCTEGHCYVAFSGFGGDDRPSKDYAFGLTVDNPSINSRGLRILLSLLKGLVPPRATPRPPLTTIIPISLS